jgi:hypothetical protein
MRRFAALVAAIGVCAAACGDGAERGRARWIGSWTIDGERTVPSLVDFQLAEMEEMRRSSGMDPFVGAAPGAVEPRVLDEVTRNARASTKALVADVDLAADGSAQADLYFGGMRVKYTGTWSEVGNGAEMKIVSRAEGLLQDRDTIPVRFRREDTYLVVGGETDAQGKPRPLTDVNTVTVKRSIYLIRK